MRYQLCVRAGYPRPGRHIWYDDQREVHRQLFEAKDGAVDDAFMGVEAQGCCKWCQGFCECG
jgi:putative restriction endonuclease